MGKEILARVFGKQGVGIEVGGKAGGIYSENKEQEAFERLQVVLRTEGRERKSLLWQLGREWKEEGKEEPISGAWLAGKFLAEEGRRWRETAEALTVRSDGDKVAIDFLRGYWENTIWGCSWCRSMMLDFLDGLAEKRGGKENLAEGEVGESLGYFFEDLMWRSYKERDFEFERSGEWKIPEMFLVQEGKVPDVVRVGKGLFSEHDFEQAIDWLMVLKSPLLRLLEAFSNTELWDLLCAGEEIGWSGWQKFFRGCLKKYKGEEYFTRGVDEMARWFYSHRGSMVFKTVGHRVLSWGWMRRQLWQKWWAEGWLGKKTMWWVGDGHYAMDESAAREIYVEKWPISQQTVEKCLLGRGLFRFGGTRKDLERCFKGRDLSEEEKGKWRDFILETYSEQMFMSQLRSEREVLRGIDGFWEIFSFGPENLRCWLMERRERGRNTVWDQGNRELLLRATAFHLENKLKNRRQGKRDREKFDREVEEMMGLWRELIPEAKRERFLKKHHLKKVMVNFWKELLGNTETPAAIQMAKEYFPDVFEEAHGHGEC